MSSPRYRWWGYVKSMVREYPLQRRTPGLSATEMRECRAVESAVQDTRRFPDGELRLHLVDLVFWRSTHTLQGAAMQCHVSYSTAQRWHGEFIRQVAAEFGL